METAKSHWPNSLVNLNKSITFRPNAVHRMRRPATLLSSFNTIAFLAQSDRISMTVKPFALLLGWTCTTQTLPMPPRSTFFDPASRLVLTHDSLLSLPRIFDESFRSV